ncbi:MAG: Asp-tRNA(Asn)/Glu-tRNA(Gln) amidotransferase subunit GatB [Nanoarchaeota archaeon]
MNFTSDIIIGLEIHIELDTETKLFCGCNRKRDEDEEPNTRVCPVCLGHPGAKPRLNKKAVEHAMRLALATKSEITPELVFSRKSYFYPDLAKNYQVSQYEIPLASKGVIELPSGKEIQITRIHMEEDPASLIHPGGMGKSNYVLVDYNRSGDPLCEMVTEPVIESPVEAREFMKQLHTLLKYLKIFDIKNCLIKADANISIKESGYKRAEIKNITGFKEIERAINYEVERQKEEVKEGKSLFQETRAWDAFAGITRPMRKKETEDDYGYIIEPDLVKTNITTDLVEKLRKELPELPNEKAARYIKELGLDPTDATVISSSYGMACMFEVIAGDVDPVLTAKWLRRELTKVMNYQKIDFDQLRITTKHLKDLLSLLQSKKITENIAQNILEKLSEKTFDVKEYVKKEGLEAVSDESELERYCTEAINEAQKAVEDYRAGNEKSMNFIVGIVMKKTRGKASPNEVKEIIKRLIDGE